MTPDVLQKLLRAVAAGDLSPDDAARKLTHLPISEVPEAQATLDTHRALRTGYPEVILAEWKSADQVRATARRLREHGQPVLITRVSDEVGEAVATELNGDHDALSRTVTIGEGTPPKGRPVVVVGAGTSDAPVTAEAARTATFSGARVEVIHDVGVAGLHRITRHEAKLREAGVLVVVAGMEGALPSVVAGLAGRPVIAVPTSVGYGAAFGGIAALLGMLNSCAAGVSVVNIDNGFGAGRLSAMLAREMTP